MLARITHRLAARQTLGRRRFCTSNPSARGALTTFHLYRTLLGFGGVFGGVYMAALHANTMNTALMFKKKNQIDVLLAMPHVLMEVLVGSVVGIGVAAAFPIYVPVAVAYTFWEVYQQDSE